MSANCLKLIADNETIWHGSFVDLNTVNFAIAHRLTCYTVKALDSLFTIFTVLCFDGVGECK